MGDGNVVAKKKKKRWHDGHLQHNNQTVKDSGLFNYELCRNKLTNDFQKTTVS